MMTKLEQAARQALEAIGDCSPNKALVKAAYALREALAGDILSPTEQAEQKPVAWAHPSGGYLSARYMKEFATGLEKETYTIPLYAAPVRTKDLTDDEIDAIEIITDRQFARAVIAADRRKNK